MHICMHTLTVTFTHSQTPPTRTHTHAHARTRTRTHTHARTHAHTHTHTRTGINEALIDDYRKQRGNTLVLLGPERPVASAKPAARRE
jgi:hypothetical protein